MEVLSGRLSHRPVKSAVFYRWLLILPVYSGSKHNVPLYTGTGAFAFLFVWPYKVLGVVSYGRKWVIEIGIRRQEIGDRR